MSSHRFIQLDVFTREPFAGNPLAVFPEAEGLTDEQMMKIAREMNLSETVFVLRPVREQSAESNQQSAKSEPKAASDPTSTDVSEPSAQTAGTENRNAGEVAQRNLQANSDSPKVLRRLRIFTPAREIPFAGHPVVGTWNALAHEGVVPLPENNNGWTRIYQEVGIGVLPVDIEFEAGVPVQVVMTQGNPKMGNVLDDRGEQEDLTRALGLAIEDLDETLPIQVISTGLPFLAVPIRSLADLRRCRVNAALLAEIYDGTGATGCSVFSRETIEIGAARVHTRMFAPGDNIPEDPATGSAAGALGAYLVHHGAQSIEPIDGQFRFVIEQGDFMHRPSRINIEVTGKPGAVTEVRVGGPSVIVAHGEVFV
ncbi:MAG: PhzF family phenazine biosynthesis protein [Pyrinomonadaceae bacterium]|nr:PhzF family phenazine biosynthesis protein [Pyrinomonadaceae bacterium]